MKIITGKSKWDAWDDPLQKFIQRVAEADFNATEIYLCRLPDSPSESRELHETYGLQLIGQIATHGVTVDGHLKSLEAAYLRALEYAPMKINAHAGRDIFSFKENLRILQLGYELSDSFHVPLCFETHRSRALYNLPATRHYVEALPTLRLTADFSHFTVVHESDLSDQLHNLAVVISRVDHVHARVGYHEGPQVPDPRAPEWNGWTNCFMDWWKQIAIHTRERGAEHLSITPEFGPPPYMPCTPFDNRPVADVWTINVWMRGLLVEMFAELQAEANNVQEAGR